MTFTTGFTMVEKNFWTIGFFRASFVAAAAALAQAGAKKAAPNRAIFIFFIAILYQKDKAKAAQRDGFMREAIGSC